MMSSRFLDVGLDEVLAFAGSHMWCYLLLVLLIDGLLQLGKAMWSQPDLDRYGQP